MNELPNLAPLEDWTPWDHEAFDRTIRERAPGMTSAELARWAGLSGQTVNRLRLTDDHRPRVDVVERLAYVLGVDPRVERWVRPIPRRPIASLTGL